MDNGQTQKESENNIEEGSYSASLLGTISSHLAGLKGFDIMALELIQNADDAKAKTISFNITEKGLSVFNDESFSYCGDLRQPTCSNEDESCDFHRIIKVASGGKQANPDHIGRFGIGFVSTYQVTDYPEIESSGIKIRLQPETGKWVKEAVTGRGNGTTFTLPWATDSNSKVRTALKISHITESHIIRLEHDFVQVLKRSLLFLRNIESATVKKDGEILFSCELSRQEAGKLKVSYLPSLDKEVWHIIEGSIKPQLRDIYDAYPKLSLHGRSPKISIAFRVEPAPLEQGTLYAYLPTEQSAGIPAHINADFFPEPDRKAIILNGDQHEQAWNEYLLKEAASIISKSALEILDLIGVSYVWGLINKALKTYEDEKSHPIFDEYWNHFFEHCSDLAIAEDKNKQRNQPAKLLLAAKGLTTAQLNALEAVGCKILSEELRTHWPALQKFRSKQLSIDLLTDQLHQYFSSLDTIDNRLSDDEIQKIHIPLAEFIEQSKKFPEELRNIPFLVTDNSLRTSLNKSYIPPANLKSDEILANFDDVNLVGGFLSKLPNIRARASTLTLDDLLASIRNLQEISCDTFYKLLQKVDQHTETSESTYRKLYGLSIWVSGDSLHSGEDLLVPGGFHDPTGQANLLNTKYFDHETIRFVSEKIGLKRQELDTYIAEVLPTLFSESGPKHPDTYQALIKELAQHPSAIDNPDSRLILKNLAIIPTQSGKWGMPDSVYSKAEELESILGDNKALWVDWSRIPEGYQVSSFIKSLGILEKASTSDLVDRILAISKNTLPTEQAVKKSADVFYLLFEGYKTDDLTYQQAVDRLIDVPCLPAKGDGKSWYSPSDLYAPYRSEGFASQVNILAYSANKLNRDVLPMIGIKVTPETNVVIDHLMYCIANEEEPHGFTYVILNERSVEYKEAVYDRLANEPCIYNKSKKKFFLPSQLFWIEPKLGKYAARIPKSFEQYRAFFEALGVKEQPDIEDYIATLSIIINSRSPLDELDHESEKIYYSCLKNISARASEEGLDPSAFEDLKQLPSVLTASGKLVRPNITFLRDSAWHAELFPPEVQSLFCDLPPSLYPLLEIIGVNKLSKVIKTRLSNQTGVEQKDLEVPKTLLHKLDVVLRMFDDESTQQVLRETVQSFSCFSYESLTIVAEIPSNDMVSPDSEREAYFDNDSQRLFIKRPFKDNNWLHIFTALLHALIPGTEATDISKTVLSLSPLMPDHMSLKDAHMHLDSAGVASIREMEDDYEISSEELDSFDDADEIPAQNQPTNEGAGANDISTSDDTEHFEEGSNHKQENKELPSVEPLDLNSNGYTGSVDKGTNNWGKFNDENPDRNRGESSSASSNSNSNRNQNTSNSDPYRTTQKRQNNSGETRKQRNQRFVSYLMPDTEVESKGEESNEARQHNLAIEELARDAVCVYEKQRGRLAEQMSQTQPGYDVRSVDESGEIRYIEVKGISGEWNERGITLSSYQFSQAKMHKDQYWLYVVEDVASQNKEIAIYPIQNPAQRVTSFAFDHGWRMAATNEPTDPQQPLVVGARVKAKGWGLGYIRKVEVQDGRKSMIIDFDGRGEKRVTYRFGEIILVDEDDEPIDDSLVV